MTNLNYKVMQLLLLAFSADRSNSASIRSQHENISWGPCSNDPEVAKPPNYTIQCANLTVPLDYTREKSNATLTLELLRAPALKKPSKGSVLFNFGGPGQVGRLLLAQSVDEYMAGTGYQHDLVVFDPRGTVNTLTATCYNKSEEALMSYEYPSFSNSSDTALGEIWAHNGLISEACAATKHDVGSFLDTAFVARDLISVVDALGEDGMLRYWGISYGTALGATVAAMFTERVDKILLDGVVNSHEYYHTYELQWLSDSDKIWAGFFKGCVAAPKSCALARPKVSPAQLKKEFYDFFYHLKYNPILAEGNTLVTYEALKNIIVGCIYAPNSWSQLAGALNGLYHRNVTDFTIFSGKFLRGTDNAITPDAEAAIKCSDKTIRISRKEVMMPQVYAKYNISKILGDVYVASDFECAQWKMRAQEIYQGDFHVNTKNPVLLIGNTYDPLTPLVSAKNMSSGFEGSVVL